MDLFSLLVIVIVLALVWYLLHGYVLPLLPEPFRAVVVAILVLIAILFLLSYIGIGPGVRLR